MARISTDALRPNFGSLICTQNGLIFPPDHSRQHCSMAFTDSSMSSAVFIASATGVDAVCEGVVPDSPESMKSRAPSCTAWAATLVFASYFLK